MADLETIQNMLAQLMDAVGAGEGSGAGYGESGGSFGYGSSYSLYAEVLKVQRMLQEKLDVPVSSREPDLKEPGPGAYFVGRVVKDDTTQHLPIVNALVEARYSGTGDVIRSTRTNVDGKFVLFFTSNRPVDVMITSDAYQGVALYGVIPQVY
jgi:hypothetical protein